MQVMSIAAREVKRVYGMRVSLKRVATEPDYNQMVGQLYANYLLTRYAGDVVLATAAYNMGPGKNMNQLIARVGDPRRGEISDEDFVHRMHDGETKDYVLRVVYGETMEQQAQRRRQLRLQNQEAARHRRSPPMLGHR
jgi:soluble lytic murein transglycosylase